MRAPHAAETKCIDMSYHLYPLHVVTMRRSVQAVASLEMHQSKATQYGQHSWCTPPETRVISASGRARRADESGGLDCGLEFTHRKTR